MDRRGRVRRAGGGHRGAGGRDRRRRRCGCLARTLVDAGLSVVELTVRTPAARDAEARVGVAPGMSAGCLAAAAERNLPFDPGAVTSSDLILALDAGLRHVKFLPGGIRSTLVALAGPFGAIGPRFMPTGAERSCTGCSQPDRSSLCTSADCPLGSLLAGWAYGRPSRVLGHEDADRWHVGVNARLPSERGAGSGSARRARAVRHALTGALALTGGHVGYAGRPAFRRGGDLPPRQQSSGHRRQARAVCTVVVTGVGLVNRSSTGQCASTAACSSA